MNKKKKKQLVTFLKKGLKEWSKEKEGEDWFLKIKLVNLVSRPVSFGSDAFWERVVSQILIIAEEKNITPKQVIENLFDEEDSDAWMLTFQFPNK